MPSSRYEACPGHVLCCLWERERRLLIKWYGHACFRCEGGGVSLVTEMSLAMLDGLRRGDAEAVRSVWRRLAPIERLRARNHSANNVSVIKEGMNLAGLPAGLVREPLGELDEADRRELIQILRSWGRLE